MRLTVQVAKQRHSGVEQLLQDGTARRQPSWKSNPDTLVLKLIPCTISHVAPVGLLGKSAQQLF